MDRNYCNQQSLSSGAQIAAPTPAGELEQLGYSLQKFLGSIHDINLQVRSLGDRLMGPQPEAPSSANTDQKPSCAISGLHSLSNFISVSLDELRSQVSRLERL